VKADDISWVRVNCARNGKFIGWFPGYICPPGTPSNDAIPADEMALAEAIAAWPALTLAALDGPFAESPSAIVLNADVYEKLRVWCRWCTPGEQSNDDIPRDEMLLAEGLADLPPLRPGALSSLSSAEAVVAGEGFYGCTSGDFVYPDHHAAGAALAVALEGES
jgi:hypothetical protein